MRIQCWKIPVSLAALATTLSLIAAPSATAKPDVSRDLIEPGILKVGTDAPYPPFEFGSPPHYKGFDIDLVNAIARKLDLRVKIIDTPFDTIFLRLKRGDFDLLAAAATITPERRRVVAFTNPNFDATQSLVVRRGSKIRSIRQLAGRTIGAQDGTTGEAFAVRRTPARKVIGYATSAAALASLKRGRISAAIIDEAVARGAIRRGVRGIKVSKSFSVGHRYGFAVRKRHGKLRRGVNWAFDRVKADGTYRRIYRKWFGIDPPRWLRR